MDFFYYKVLTMKAKVRELDQRELNSLSSSSSDRQLIVSQKRKRSSSFSSEGDQSMVVQGKEKKICRLITNTADSTENVEDCDVIDLRPRPVPSRAWRRVNMFPRIPKRDFRREFPTMVVNVANSGDFDAFGHFMRSTSHPSCLLLDYKRGGVNSDLTEPIHRVSGVNQIVDFLVNLISCTPDFALVLKKAQIKQHLHKGGCEVILDLHIRGTRIRDVAIEVRDEKDKVHMLPVWVYTALLVGRGVIASMPVSEAIPVISSPHNWSNFDLDINPDVVDLNVSLIHYMDNNNRVYKMEQVFT
eukprot:scaffold21_cov179-Ochromonas_danica.AAC.5